MPALNPRRFIGAAIVLAVVFALVLPSLSPRPAPRYSVTDLGVLPGDTKSRAYGINAQGQVCGFTQGLKKQACLFSSGVVTPLGSVPPGTESIARDISSAGDVTGTFGPNLTRRAFLWKRGRMRLLGTLPGFSTSEGAAINAQGAVAGLAQAPLMPPKAGFQRAFVYSHGKMINLARCFLAVTVKRAALTLRGRLSAIAILAWAASGLRLFFMTATPKQ